ncbi:hypothetical protein SteCoe_28766 [Stentor coeruleus]|uniref:RING-type domain-containing protein n=1 Tax=Stentor coeruleus TaxID=5963 RepID=A0A1R2B7F6_9CILI|nr:hypothetical protein SteCoe_28766 [Stentor coeruleus]
MSSCLKALSKLALNIPEGQISLCALFIDLSFFISSLDIDYLGSLTNFPSFKYIQAKKHVVALIKENQQNLNDNSKLDQLGLGKTSQMMCSSKEDNFSSILVLLPTHNNYFSITFEDFTYVLLRFDIKDLIGNSIEACIAHIENIKFSIAQIQKKNNDVQENIEKATQMTKEKFVAANMINDLNKQYANDLKIQKDRILELYEGFQELEDEESECGIHLRCIVCRNNLRSVMYKPCGHLTLCEECLKQNLKIDINIPIKRKRKFLYCQLCKEKVSETKAVSF